MVIQGKEVYQLVKLIVTYTNAINDNFSFLCGILVGQQ